MFSRLKELFKRGGASGVENYLKKLSVSRQDLIKEIEPVSVDTPFNAYVTLALLLKEKGEFYKSLKILERLKGEELSPEERKLVVLNLALVYRAAGFIDRAEEALKEGIEQFPGESFFYYELALLKRDVGRLEESVELLEKAASLKEEFSDELLHTKLYLASQYIDKGRTDKAFRLLRKVNPKVPLPLFYYVLSKLYYAVGEPEKGYQMALKGMKLSPKHTAPFLQVIEEGDGLSVEKLLQISKEAGLSYPVVLRLVKLYLESNDKESALKLLEEFVDGGEFWADLYELYLRLLWESGQRKKVVDRLEGLLSHLKNRQKVFRCQNCGFKTDTFDWMCPRCRSWESLELNSEN
ncbi:hypothetical protein [Thermovibrio ammonificans]|uniref:LapB rubredoxin metal binding domain-containing protein n=1 Tax=Thermovibrio ammonificans (strain DSM 15698 / JCM 12110 / HB-1) TaxID=648996 RepID=E8T219_THEA1|nr:hypothetical protein [Thermovibrio ammonificans]ADU96914.1 hypothetical protein Theam_0947 [Thermovibrio ammonificans HB-1]